MPKFYKCFSSDVIDYKSKAYEIRLEPAENQLVKKCNSYVAGK